MATLFQLIGILIILFLFWLIKYILARNKSFDDFLIGDNGTYSLSRLQMVGWVVLIISMQLSAFLILLYKGTFMGECNCYVNYYKFILPEEMLYLLGIGFTGYITVKGITIDRIAKNQIVPKNKTKRLSDLISGDNGLDFSRFQMLIWTVLAMIIYAIKSNLYFCHLFNTSDMNLLANLFELNDDNTNGLPNIDMSFIVLMGLSNGAYIGKKLVPSFKAGEMSKKLQSKTSDEIISLRIGLQFRETELNLYKNSPQYNEQKYQEMSIEIEKSKQNLKEKEEYIEKLKKEYSE